MSKKKVVIIHLPKQFFGEGIQQGFKDLGYRVIEINWQELKVKHGIEFLREKCISVVAENNPDLVFMQIQNPLIIDIETARKLQLICPVINYSFDCRSKEDSEWYYNMAVHISFTAFSNTQDVENCKDVGNFNCGVMQSSCDMKFYRKVDDVFDSRDIVFLGQNYLNTDLNFPKAQERFDMVQLLQRKYKDRFKVYGIGWNSTTIAPPTKERLIYSNAKIAITHNNYDRPLYQSDRMFRASCCGCLVIPKYYKGIKEDFKNVLSWKNFGELEYILDNLLNNPTMISNLAKQQERDVRDNHNYKRRIQKLLEQIP